MLRDFVDAYKDENGDIYTEESLAEGLINHMIFADIADNSQMERDGLGVTYIVNDDNYIGVGPFEPGHVTFDVNKAIAWGNENLYLGSNSACALHVRLMLEAGGIKTRKVSPKDKYPTIEAPDCAYKYAGWLPTQGFKNIDTIYGRQNQAVWSMSNAKPGDIAVMSHGLYGHICMWNGFRWISDFGQNNMWVYGGDGECKIFRYSTA